jgi:hypothetical protein
MDQRENHLATLAAELSAHAGRNPQSAMDTLGLSSAHVWPRCGLGDVDRLKHNGGAFVQRLCLRNLLK